jgi:hypothetical protein
VLPLLARASAAFALQLLLQQILLLILPLTMMLMIVASRSRGLRQSTACPARARVPAEARRRPALGDPAPRGRSADRSGMDRNLRSLLGIPEPYRDRTFLGRMSEWLDL